MDADAPELLINMACVSASTPDEDITNNCDDEDTHVIRPSVTPAKLGATSTPRAIPTTGGLPGSGDASGRLVWALASSCSSLERSPPPSPGAGKATRANPTIQT
ncbi:MAG TPA: hypothetical protein VIP09_08210 [Dehalococcoidia bacterium]